MKDFNQKLGLTRSFKPILQPINFDTSAVEAITVDYNPADHFDAYALFQYLISREVASIGTGSTRIDVYDVIGRLHRERLGTKEFLFQMSGLNLATIFDIIKFGQSRADPVFK